MKVYLAIAVLLLTSLSYGQELEGKVIELARADRNYLEPGTTKVVKVVSIQQSENNFYKDIDADRVALTEALVMCNKIIEQARKENDTDTYQVWAFKKERLEKFLKADKQAVDYKVLEHNYTFRNPAKGNTVTKATSYYFFDGSNNFIGSVDAQTYDDATIKFYKTDTQRYEAMLFEMKH